MKRIIIIIAIFFLNIFAFSQVSQDDYNFKWRIDYEKGEITSTNLPVRIGETIIILYGDILYVKLDISATGIKKNGETFYDITNITIKKERKCISVEIIGFNPQNSTSVYMAFNIYKQKNKIDIKYVSSNNEGCFIIEYTNPIYRNFNYKL